MRRVALSAWVIGFAAMLCLIQEFAVRLALPAYNPAFRLQFILGSADRPILGPPNETQRQISNKGDYDVAIRFNRFGLRDVKNLNAAEPRDWFVVGDSFVIGWGVDEDKRFSNVLESLSGRPVYNLSSPETLHGYKKLIEYARRQGAPVERVVLAVNMANDIDHPSKAESPEITATRDEEPFDLQSVKMFLKKHSALYFIATSLVHRASWLESAFKKMNLIKGLEEFRERNFDSEDISFSADAVEDIARMAETLVVVIPHRGLWLGQGRERETSLHHDFVAALRRRDIRVLDLKPLWEENGDPLAWHFRFDGHWNPEGHAKAAARIFEELKTIQAGGAR